MKIKISVFCWEGCTYNQIGLSKATPSLPFTPFLIPLLGLLTKEYTKETLTWRVARGHGCSKGGDREKYSSDLPLQGRLGPQQVCLPYENWDLSGVGTESRQRSTRGRPSPQKVCLPYESWVVWVHIASKEVQKREASLEWVCVCVHDDPLLYVSIRKYNLPLETSE